MLEVFMLNDAEMARVRAQRHKMAEIMQQEGISLFGPSPSLALKEFIDRINAGKGFTPQELARMDELAALTVGEKSTTEKTA